jgi:ankyrin repeat protein
MRKIRYSILSAVFLLFLQLPYYAIGSNDNLSLFVDAVHKGNIELMRELSISVDINSDLPETLRKTFEKHYPLIRFNEPITPLSIAMLKGDKNVIFELVKQGVDVKRAANMLAPFIIKGIDNCMLELFLQEGIDVNVMHNMEKVSLLPISAAILYDKYEQVKILLNHGADPNLIDNLLITPMHIAAVKGRKYIDLLMEYGGDINVGTTLSKPISAAALRGNIDAVQYLISKGADTDFIGDGNIFLISVEKNNRELAKLAIKSGAHKNGWDVLLKRAFLRKDIFLVELLLQNGYKLSDEYIAFAIAFSDVNVVKLLFEKYNAEFSMDYIIALIQNLYCHEDEGVKIYKYFNDKNLLSLNSVYEDDFTFEILINLTTSYNCSEWRDVNQNITTKTILTRDDKLKLINRLGGR